MNLIQAKIKWLRTLLRSHGWQFVHSHGFRLGKYWLATNIITGCGFALLWTGVNLLHLGPIWSNYLIVAPGTAALNFAVHRFFTWRDRSTPVKRFARRVGTFRAVMWFPPNITYIVAVCLGFSYMSVKAGTSMVWGPVAFFIYYWFYEKKATREEAE